MKRPLTATERAMLAAGWLNFIRFEIARALYWLADRINSPGALYENIRPGLTFKERATIAATILAVGRDTGRL